MKSERAARSCHRSQTGHLRGRRPSCDGSDRVSRKAYIHANAWKSCDRHYVPFLLADVVEALLALPPDRAQRGWVPRVARKFPTLEGEVFGRRFLLIGDRDEAEEWSVIFEV